MKPSPPTKEERELKRRQNDLLKLCNRIASAFSLRQCKTWEDVYRYTGSPTDAKSGPVTIIDLKSYFKQMQDALTVATATTTTTPCVSTNSQTATVRLLQESETVSAPTAKVGQVQSNLNLTVDVNTNHSPIATEVAEDLSLGGKDNDYGFVKSPNEKAFHYWFQKKAIAEIVAGFFVKHLRAQLLLASTGTGKTFMFSAAIRRAVDLGYHLGKTFGVVHYLVVTRATIVEQTDRVLREFYNLGIKDAVEVLNIEQLRSRAGRQWVDEISYVEDGVEKVRWQWKPMLNPVIVIWDECQALKNEGTTQHEIACALNDLQPPVLQLFVSATPYTRVSEVKCFAVATGKDVSHILKTPNYTPLTNANWPAYAAIMAGDGFKPTDYNDAAVERVTKDLDEYIVRVKGVRPQFDAINSIKIINFQTKEEEKEYHDAYIKYLKEKEKLDKMLAALGKEDSGAGNSKFQMLVEFLKFRMAAEKCRREYLAARLAQFVKEGYAGVCALNFKGTIISVVKLLIEKHGFTRDQISLIWGGGQTQLTAKQKAKRDIVAKATELTMAGLDATTLLKALNLDEVEDRVLEELPEHLRLSTQTKEERQREIDRFQSGKSKICLYTFRAGGVGLSLHHTDELSKVKVRHQKNGYAVLEDIPLIPVRERRTIVAPTYSAIELVQGLGRCPRLTSLSNTHQELVFYHGTIEEDVARIVSNKLRCLSKVVRHRESWADVCIGGVKAEAHIDESAMQEVGTDYDTLNTDEEGEDE